MLHGHAGLHSAGFPNLFIVSGPQGGGGHFNFTLTLEEHSDYIVWMLRTLRHRGERVVDVRRESEEDWAEHCRQVDTRTAPLRDCASYYNGEGGAAPGSLAYYGGGQWHDWREEARGLPTLWGSQGGGAEW